MNKSKEAIDSLLTFLEPINAYDREEVVFNKCKNLDPESRTSIRRLLDEQYFMDQWYSDTSPSIKINLTSNLIAALSENYDFEWLVHEADGTFQLPDILNNTQARIIYEEIYRAIYHHWRQQLEKSGMNIPAPAELGVAPFA